MKSNKINSGLFKDGEQCLSSARTQNCQVEAQVGMPSENPFGQWISVKDKFPDEDIPVLVRVKKPLGEVGRYTVNRWTSYTDQNKEWFNKHFSHWMPLPKF